MIADGIALSRERTAKESAQEWVESVHSLDIGLKVIHSPFANSGDSRIGVVESKPTEET